MYRKEAISSRKQFPRKGKPLLGRRNVGSVLRRYLWACERAPLSSTTAHYRTLQAATSRGKYIIYIYIGRDQVEYERQVRRTTSRQDIVCRIEQPLPRSRETPSCWSLAHRSGQQQHFNACMALKPTTSASTSASPELQVSKSSEAKATYL